MGRVAHPLSFGGFITTEGAPSLRSWRGWEPRTYNSPVLTFGNLGPCWGWPTLSQQDHRGCPILVAYFATGGGF